MDYIKYTPEISNNWSRAYYNALRDKPYVGKRLADSMTTSQIQSKLWVYEELSKIGKGWKNVAVIGGWYCHVLSVILFDELDCKFVCNYDIDRDSQLISYQFNRRYKTAAKYMASRKNLFLMHLEERQICKGAVDLVINTSCEHMFMMNSLKEKHFKNPLKSPLFVLQSTDDDQYDDHINCVSNAEELADQADLVDVKYSGSKKLDNGMTRFMVIGR